MANPHAVALKEAELGPQAVELQAAQEAGVNLHAREQGRAVGGGRLDYAGQASLDIAAVVPGAVGSTIRRPPLDELRRCRPRALTQRSAASGTSRVTASVLATSVGTYSAV